MIEMGFCAKFSELSLDLSLDLMRESKVDELIDLEIEEMSKKING